jgi:hypothetical protein
MTGEIPQSTALREASPDSLTELFSRDPEGYQQRDRTRLVEELRLYRARLAKVAAASPSPKTKVQVKTPTKPVSATSLGFSLGKGKPS